MVFNQNFSYLLPSFVTRCSFFLYSNFYTHLHAHVYIYIYTVDIDYIVFLSLLVYIDDHRPRTSTLTLLHKPCFIHASHTFYTLTHATDEKWMHTINNDMYKNNSNKENWRIRAYLLILNRTRFSRLSPYYYSYCCFPTYRLIAY